MTAICISKTLTTPSLFKSQRLVLGCVVEVVVVVVVLVVELVVVVVEVRVLEVDEVLVLLVVVELLGVPIKTAPSSVIRRTERP